MFVESLNHTFNLAFLTLPEAAANTSAGVFDLIGSRAQCADETRLAAPRAPRLDEEDEGEEEEDDDEFEDEDDKLDDDEDEDDDDIYDDEDEDGEEDEDEDDYEDDEEDDEDEDEDDEDGGKLIV